MEKTFEGYTAKSLAEHVLEAAEGDRQSALDALCDGAYLAQVFGENPYKPETKAWEDWEAKGQDLVENAHSLLQA